MLRDDLVTLLDTIIDEHDLNVSDVVWALADVCSIRAVRCFRNEAVTKDLREDHDMLADLELNY